MPASSRILATATPAAPAPEMTTRVDSGLRPVSRSAFLSAASATTAVPCWSSWKTGMSSSSLSRSSISKQRGAEMSSRLMPPKLGRQPDDGLDDLLDVGGVQADRDGVDAAELLEQHGLALHHRHRGGRADVAEAEDGGAVGDDGDGVRHPGVVLGQRRVRGDRLADPGDARACRPATGRRGRRARRSSGSPSCRRRAGRRPGHRRRGGASAMTALTFQTGGRRTVRRGGGPARRAGVVRGTRQGLGGSSPPSSLAQRHSRRGRGQTRATRDGDHVLVGDRPAVPRVDALVGVVAEQPPGRRRRRASYAARPRA